jgi:hypothetical protein
MSERDETAQKGCSAEEEQRRSRRQRKDMSKLKVRGTEHSGRAAASQQTTLRAPSEPHTLHHGVWCNGAKGGPGEYPGWRGSQIVKSQEFSSREKS